MNNTKQYYIVIVNRFKEMKGEVWGFTDKVITFLNDHLIGGLKEFLNWSIENFNFEDFRNETLYETLKREEYALYFKNSNVIRSTR